MTEQQLDLSDPVNLTEQLCNFESVSGNEAALADAIFARVSELPHLICDRDGDTIVCRTSLGREQRVVIAGHIDTVPVNNNLPVKTVAETPVEGDATPDTVLWGRGTVDMKAGVAVQLVLAAELDNPAYDITWVWYDNEEVSSDLNGLGRTLRNSPELFAGDFAILGEPSNGTVEGGCNGTLRCVVSFAGKRAHSVCSWTGVNAIQRAGETLVRLNSYVAETVTVDGLEYREGLNAVRISGGVAGNVIPDSCKIEVNYRFCPAKSPAEAEAFVREFFADADSVEIVDLAPGARPGLDAPLAKQLVEAVGQPPRAKVGWTDVARFSELNIPAVNYGPGDPLLAHADDERVSANQIRANYLALYQWLTQNQLQQ